MNWSDKEKFRKKYKFCVGEITKIYFPHSALQGTKRPTQNSIKIFSAMDDRLDDRKSNKNRKGSCLWKNYFKVTVQSTGG